MSEKSKQFTMDEIKFMYGLIKEAKSNIQELLQELDLNDPERDFVLDSQKIANSCFRKLKMIVSENP